MAKMSPALILRLPASLHARATELAHEEGVSLTTFITAALAARIERAETKGGAPDESALTSKKEASGHPGGETT